MTGEELRLGFAFGLGAATFFAPCAFPLLPGYIAYYLGHSDGDGATAPVAVRLRRAALIGILASLGFFIVYAVLAGVVAAIGTRALSNISVLELVVGTLLIVLGSAMALGVRPTAHIQLPERRRTPGGFLLFGVVYAVAAAGCTAPLFIGLSGIALSGGPVAAVSTFAAYAVGMSVLMIGVTATAAIGHAAALRRVTRNVGRINRAAGVVLAIAGVVQIYFFLFRFDGFAILGFA